MIAQREDRRQRSIAHAATRPDFRLLVHCYLACRVSSCSLVAVWGPRQPDVFEWHLLMSIGLEPYKVGIDHHAHEVVECDRRLPSKHALGLGRVTHNYIDFSRAEELRVLNHMISVVHADVRECDVTQFPYGVRLPRGDDIV